MGYLFFLVNSTSHTHCLESEWLVMRMRAYLQIWILNNTRAWERVSRHGTRGLISTLANVSALDRDSSTFSSC